ncbi:MAG: DUF2341 domain-containing protein [Chloroflexota bacterium]|nr:DUF2341 domain-containing protein [Chloroflexota bacterium]
MRGIVTRIILCLIVAFVSLSADAIDYALALNVNNIDFKNLNDNSGWPTLTKTGFEEGVLIDTVSLDDNTGRLAMQWYDSLWSYRRPVTIDNAGGALTDYQIEVSITYDSDMQPDFDDVRFTDDNCVTLLSHWRESYVASTSAEFWVKVPSIAAASTKTIYMYYGNPAAPDISDGDATFEFFDDFEDGDISDWSQYGSGTVAWANDSGNGVLLKTANDDPNGGYSLFNNGAIGDFEMICRTNRINSAGGSQNRYGIEDGSFNGYGPRMYGFTGTSQTFAIERRTGGTSAGNIATTTFTGNPNTWYTIQFRRYGNTLEFELYDSSDVLVQSVSGSDVTYSSFDRFLVHGGRDFWTDDIRVRKYASSDPSAAVGPEEVRWFDQEWTRRLPLTISNSGGALTNYQVKVSLTYDSDMQPDFEDLRFTDSDGVTLLSHWQESYIDSTSAELWVKVPSIAAGSTSRIYVYYGSPSATSTSDGDATFEFFDDFEDGDISDWSQYGSGTVAWANDSGNGVLLKTANNDPNGGYSLFNNGAIGDFEMICRTNRINTSGGSQNRYGIEDGSFNGYGPRMYGFTGSSQTFAIERRTGGSSAGNIVTTTFTGNPNTWYTVKFRKYGNILEFELYDSSDVLVQSVSGSDATYSSFDRFLVHGGYDFWTDDIKVRKYASPEPTVSIGPSAWYDSGWTRRVPITVDNTLGGALTNYQVEVFLTYDSDMQSDFDDIRFTDSDKVSLLPYWTETYTDSTSGTFWVKIPSIPAASSMTIYAYYGNPAVASLSDGDATFEFFDDFEDGDISDWSQYGSGTVAWANDSGNGVLLKTANNDPSGGYSLFNNGAISDFEMVCRTNRINSSGGAQNRYGIEDGIFNGYGPQMTGFTGASGNLNIELRTGGVGSGTIATSSYVGNPNAWYTVKFRKYGTSLQVELYDSNDVLVQSTSGTDATYNSFDRFLVHGGWEFWTDDIRVRKYSSSDPTTSKGIEESSTGEELPVYAANGTIASDVFDTGILGTEWVNVSWGETLPPGTIITFEVRASDTAFLKTDAAPAWQDVSALPLNGRYQQWRATLTASGDTPVLHDVRPLVN